MPYSSKVGILLLLDPEPPPTLTVSWLSPTIRMTCSHRRSSMSGASLPCTWAQLSPDASWHATLLLDAAVGNIATVRHATPRTCRNDQDSTDRLWYDKKHVGIAGWPDLRPDLRGVSAQGLQNPGSHTLALAQEAEQDVLCSNVVVACETQR